MAELQFVRKLSDDFSERGILNRVYSPKAGPLDLNYSLTRKIDVHSQTEVGTSGELGAEAEGAKASVGITFKQTWGVDVGKSATAGDTAHFDIPADGKEYVAEIGSKVRHFNFLVKFYCDEQHKEPTGTSMPVDAYEVCGAAVRLVRADDPDLSKSTEGSWEWYRGNNPDPFEYHPCGRK
ncbi:hypothetical protein [Pseudonocardia acaciae]|uniref:hypothetical protein n=1 Tax=Pseudonocardia acaciae TaxID=551276 RepID=UPI0012ED1E2E|nr:hypothetical protein [Pseudonocardia acaciae]